MHHRIRRTLGTLVSAALLGSGLVALDVPAAHAAYPVPPTPAGLTAGIEAIQPYVGQSTCDPVAKAGVKAFRDLLLRTYSDSSSLGIVRSCDVGGQSEHKEGRAFDWGMSAYNTRQKAEVQTLLSWLLATDKYGNKYAMARRFGIMYMIWNKHIFKLYDAAAGWQAYSGDSAHTDHVHFSFGWSGAKKTTSYWDGTVAAIDFGPNGPPHVTPVRSIANIALRRQYGGLTLAMHSTGTAVKVMQKALLVKDVDGDFGSGTQEHVMKFQVDQKLPMTGRFGPEEWKRLFPYPIAPFGKADVPSYVLGNVVVRGWAIDADTQAPVSVDAVVDGAVALTAGATLPRNDVATSYPEWGANRGFELLLPVADGSHQVCLVARNVVGTPGTDTPLGCTTVDAQHNPIGGISSLSSALGTVSLRGWALDPDAAGALATSLTVDGVASAVVPTAVTRTDVAARYPGIGDQQGVAADLDLPEGTHTVCLLAPNAVDTAGSDATVACKTVKVEHSPVGLLDPVLRVPGGVRVQGWALDPDLAQPADVEVRSNDAPVASLVAGITRKLPTTYAPQGSAHGFSTVLDLPTGSQQVCVGVVNGDGTPGDDLAMPCSTLVVSHDAAGALTAMRQVPGGGVLVTGDAYDPDSLSATKVTVLLDGKAVSSLTASKASTTSATRWPGYGSGHGFAATVQGPRGLHTLCVRAENLAPSAGTAVSLGCKRLVLHDPVGGVTSWHLSSRTVTFGGWAVDPDTKTATRVYLLVDGVAVTSLTADRYRSYLGTSVMPGYGSYHGVAFTRKLSAGTHTLCLRGANSSGTTGVSRGLGCQAIKVA